jgi:glycosyltransferase involved in cell wall biosynthesis
VAPSVPTRDGRREGIPVVLMEALAVGVAVVASDLSGIPEIIRHDHTGLLAPPGDSRAIAQAIQRLAEDAALRRRLTQAGRQLVEREFDLRQNVRRLATLFGFEPPLEFTQGAGWGPKSVDVSASEFQEVCA